jgi:hypothetical protein
MISSFSICSISHSTSNWSWRLPVSSFPIHISPQIKSWHHPLSSFLIHILLQVGRESFQSYPFKSTKHFIWGHDRINSQPFKSTEHHKLGQDIFLYHLFWSTYYFKLVVTSFIHICSNPHNTPYWVMTASFQICYKAYIISNSLWKAQFISFPIHIAIYICPDIILYYLFQSKYHLKLGHDIILYHLF